MTGTHGISAAHTIGRKSSLMGFNPTGGNIGRNAGIPEAWKETSQRHRYRRCLTASLYHSHIPRPSGAALGHGQKNMDYQRSETPPARNVPQQSALTEIIPVVILAEETGQAVRRFLRKATKDD